MTLQAWGPLSAVSHLAHAMAVVAWSRLLLVSFCDAGRSADRHRQLCRQVTEVGTASDTGSSPLSRGCVQCHPMSQRHCQTVPVARRDRRSEVCQRNDRRRIKPGDGQGPSKLCQRNDRRRSKTGDGQGPSCTCRGYPARVCYVRVGVGSIIPPPSPTLRQRARVLDNELSWVSASKPGSRWTHRIF